MAKISNTTSYPNATPAANDYVIGTDIDDNNATKTFKLQEIANLYAGSGSGTVTSVGLDGGATGLTITSDTTNPITTTGTFTLGGTLAVANGGTGLSALGTRSQVMSVNNGATGLEFADPKVIETIEANENLVKGDPLYIVSWNNGTSTAVVGKADASDSNKMPCVGLAQENLTTGATGEMMVVGLMDQVDVNAIPSSGPNPLVNDVIYVASGGGLTSIKPTGTNLIQNIAIVVNASAQGTLQITAIGRTNDLPNLPEGSIWLGDSNGVPSALGIGANTYVLTSNGTTASWAAATGGSGISFNGTTASGIVSRGGATTADVSSDIIVAGSQILFDGSAGNTGVKYDLGTNKFQIGAIGGGVDTVDIYSAGVNSLTISSTVSQFKNSSHTLFDNGIKLGSTGETLDAYEEGTWTPVMFNSTSPSYTSSGTYIKIGKKVTVWFYINCTVGGSASVASYISGLPFNAVAVNGRRGTAVINQNTGNSASVNYVGGKPGGATTIILQKYTSGTSYVLANGEWPNTQGNFTVEGQYTYYSLA